MIVERITKEAQATIPDAVLEALGLAPGDAIAFDIVDGSVRLRRADGLPNPIDEERASAETVLQSGTATLKALIDEALRDPRPSIPAARIFADLRALHEDRLKRDG